MSTPVQLADLFAHAPQARHKGVTTPSRCLTMRDGTKIASDVMLPADPAPGARIPASGVPILQVGRGGARASHITLPMIIA
jgi:predicted acyl esterase